MTSWSGLIFIILFFALVEIIYNLLQGKIKKNKKTQSQEQLIKKFEKTKKGNKRAEPVNEINDQRFLAETAFRDPDEYVRMRAVANDDFDPVLSIRPVVWMRI